MKPISISQVESLVNAKQNFCDCYLVSSLSAIANNKKGKEILRKNILTDGDAFCVKFNDVYGKEEQYLVKQKECNDLILTDKYLEVVPLTKPHNPIVKAVEVAMTKLLKQHFFKKNILSRAIKCNEIFEYNKPSDFMKMLTGIKPVTLNESTLSNTMKNKKESTFQLLDRISEEKEKTFIAGTGFKFIPTRITSWHCYNIKEIDAKNRIVMLYDNKQQTNIRTTYDDIANKFKFICGYFDNMF